MKRMILCELYAIAFRSTSNILAMELEKGWGPNSVVPSHYVDMTYIKPG